MHDQMFQTLLSEVASRLMIDRHVYYIHQLSKRYDEILKQHSNTAQRPYRTDRLMKRFFDNFGSNIQFITLNNGTLICFSSLTTKKLCDEVVELKAEVDEYQLFPDLYDGDNFNANVSGSSYPLAKQLQMEIKQAEKRVPQVHGTAIEIFYKKASNQVPIDLNNNLAWLITNYNEKL